MFQKLDLMGLRSNQWTVIGPPKPERPRYWLCRCDCGKEKYVFGPNVKSGLSASCGCLIGKSAKERLTKHGLADTKPHMIWCTMRQRCENPNNKGYRNYGGRGIKICARWHDFVNFWEDMGPTWKAGLTLERRDNNGDYEPDNCIWIPKSEQSKNRRPYSEWKFKDADSIAGRGIPSA